MPMERKVKTFEEKTFNKSWAKLTKLRPNLRFLKSTVGKAPKCSNNGGKALNVAVASVATKKKK